jgi:ParB family chromosome partitioning protein
MSTKPFDLSALDAVPDFSATSGKPLLLDIDMVHEDPDQPRKSFDPEAMAELTASISERGVKSPVSVRPHPQISGHYMLNFGARRLRASKAAGRKSIPAFVDTLHTDYDQVVENLQRDNLTPMEMALFISTRLKSGVTAADMARKLGLSKAAITKFMALVDAPPEVEAVYTSGRCRSPDALYELRQTLKKWPEETAAWIEADTEITRRTVDDFKRTLTSGRAEVKEPVSESSGPGPADPISTVTPRRMTEVPPLRPKTRHVLVIRYGDRTGVALTDRMPQNPTDIPLRWDDTGEVEEVLATELSIEGIQLR